MFDQMRRLHLNLDQHSGPLYQRLSKDIRTAIREGRAEAGTLLPSTRELASQLGVHRHTVLRALENLVSEGWLLSEPGRGFRVIDVFFEELKVSPPQWPTVPSVSLPDVSGHCPYGFPSGLPDLRLFPQDEFFRILRSVLRTDDPKSLLTYSDPAGSMNFRKALQNYLTRIRGLTQGHLVVTHGSQEAIFLLAQLLLQGPRKTVLVESLGYRPAWEAMKMAGGRLVGVPVDDEGLRVDALEKLIESEVPALLYLTPLHQYPTTATLSLSRRHRLLELIQKHQIPVIEDDYDHEFHYAGQPSLPLASLDDSGLVVYVSTFSKLVYPSARLGYALVCERLFEPLCQLKRWTSRQNDILIQETMVGWMDQGGLERHLRRMRKVYAERLNFMLDGLESLGLRPKVPGGGMSLWVDTRCPADKLRHRCKDLGLAVPDGNLYYLEKPEPTTSFLRLGFASNTADEIERGIEILGQAMADV